MKKSRQKPKRTPRRVLFFHGLIFIAGAIFIIFVIVIEFLKRGVTYFKTSWKKRQKPRRWHWPAWPATVIFCLFTVISPTGLDLFPVVAMVSPYHWFLHDPWSSFWCPGLVFMLRRRFSPWLFSWDLDISCFGWNSRGSFCLSHGDFWKQGRMRRGLWGGLDKV